MESILEFPTILATEYVDHKTTTECCDNPIIKNHGHLVAHGSVVAVSELFGDSQDVGDFVSACRHLYIDPYLDDGELVGARCEHCDLEVFDPEYEQ